MIPIVKVIGGRNPDVILSLQSVRGGWKIDTLRHDTYRISRKNDVFVIHAPTFNTGHQVTIIHSNLTSNLHVVKAFVIEDSWSREQIASLITSMFVDLLEPMAA